MPKRRKRRMAIHARVSTLDQDPLMQLRELRELRAYAKHRRFTMAHACMDQVRSATRERPELG